MAETPDAASALKPNPSIKAAQGNIYNGVEEPVGNPEFVDPIAGAEPKLSPKNGWRRFFFVLLVTPVLTLIVVVLSVASDNDGFDLLADGVALFGTFFAGLYCANWLAENVIFKDLEGAVAMALKLIFALFFLCLFWRISYWLFSMIPWFDRNNLLGTNHFH